MTLSSQAQTDTVVLNSTEFRFPETHPGRVFVVKKVVVNGQQGLRKDAEVPPPSAPSNAAAPGAIAGGGGVSRDAMGRVLKGGEYASRLARIRQAHALPTVAARNVGTEGLVTEAGNGHVARYQKSEDARFAIASNSPLIRSWRDLVRLEKAEREAVRKKYGTLGKTFNARVNALRDKDSLDVVIELEADHPGHVNGVTATLEERIQNARAWAKSRSRVAPSDFLRQRGLTEARVGQDKSSRRLAMAKASKAQLLELKDAPGVVSVRERKKPAVATIPGAAPTTHLDLIASAQNPAGSMVEYDGLAVATLESGLGNTYVYRLPGNMKPVAYEVGSWSPYPGGLSPHSEGTYHLLAAAATGHDKYHFNRWYFWEIQDSIVDHQISSLSSSWAWAWDDPTNEDSRAIDLLAITYPYSLISIPTGNLGGTYSSVAQTYNSLAVGNVQHYDLSHYQMDMEYVRWDSVLGFVPVFVPGTQWKNPNARYGSTNDWELPSLVAPGFTPDPYWGVTLEGVWFSNGVDWSPPGGSSLSSPITAAMGAHVMAAYPQGTSVRTPFAKAILLLTAQNVDSGYWAPGVQDSRDGAGTISGANAVHFADNAVTVFPNNDPEVSAIGSGYMTEYDFDHWNTVTHQYKVPSTIPSGKHLRVVLTWTSSPGYNVAENEISDLSLDVQTNSGWKTSDTWNSNTEIIDVSNSELTPNGTYSIGINPKIHRMASDGTDYLYYAIAWTWVKDHAD
jgi:hypothetical protein